MNHLRNANHVFLDKLPKLNAEQQKMRSVAYRTPKRVSAQKRPGRTFVYTPMNQLGTVTSNERALAPEASDYRAPTAFESWF